MLSHAFNQQRRCRSVGNNSQATEKCSLPLPFSSYNKCLFTYGAAAEREYRRIRKILQSRNLKELYTFADKAAFLAESIALAKTQRLCPLRCRTIDERLFSVAAAFGRSPQEKQCFTKNRSAPVGGAMQTEREKALFFFVPCTARFFFWQRKRNVGCKRIPPMKWA